MAEIESSHGVCGIQKLRGTDNFADWKFQVRNYLENKDWWKVIEIEVLDEKLADIDRKARTTICLLIEPLCFTHVYKAKTAKDTWINLCKAFEDKGWGRRITLQRQLWQCKLENFESMEKYISRIVFLSQQLADIDAEIKDDWIVSIMLSGLTEEYNPLIMAVDNCGNEVSLEQIKNKLLQEANRQKDAISDVQALAINKSKNVARSFQKTNDRKPRIFRCYRCHQEGHKASECKKKQTATSNICMNTGEKNPFNKNCWYLDSGCSNHMTHDKSKLSDYKTQKTNMKIKVANGEELSVRGRGTAEPNVSRNAKLTLENVLHVPGLSMNLISVSNLASKNYATNFNKEGCTIQRNDQIVATCHEVGGIYELKEKENYLANLTMSNEILSNLWHKRLAHLSRNYMNSLKNLVTGTEYKIEDLSEPCIPCISGKTSKSPFKNKGTRAKQCLEIVHSDLCGPMEEPSFSGNVYMLLFIDDYTRKTHVYFLRNKSQTFDKFREYKAEVEKETSKSIRIFRSDNGLEFCSKRFDDYLKSSGIKHQKTVPYTPQQNGVAERANRTIIEKARTLLCEANLSKKFWAEAVDTVVYLKNRSPTKAVMNAVPEELWTGRKVDLSHLRIFGCLTFALLPKQKRRKLDMKTEPLIFIGYCTNTKGYRLMQPNTGKVTVARDVKFLENTFPGDQGTPKSTVVPIVLEEEQREPVRTSFNGNDDSEDEFLEAGDNSVESIDIQTDENIPAIVSEPVCELTEPENVNELGHLERRYNLREHKPVNYKCNAVAEIDGDPVTIEDALARPDREMWQKAIDNELQSLKENGTWTLVELPLDKKPIQCKWVFKIKRDSDGKVSKYKARLVVKGFTQVRGVDYNETYSPVIRSSTLRLLFSLAAEYGWFIDQWDVTTAFLYGKLKEDIYMLQPKGAVVKGQETKVCKLQKSIYGLKQASNAWFNELDKEMLNLGFQQSKIEPCLYQKRLEDNSKLIVVIYVDDLFVFGNNEYEKQKLKAGLLNKFKVKDLGPARHVLGMRLRRENNIIYLDQEQYIHNVLDNFQMTDCKPVTTPMEVGLILEKAPADTKCSLPYQSLIGCLNYLAVNTRPDIAHVVSVLSQFNSCYDDLHFKCAKRVLRYLKQTMNLCLTFKKSGKLDLCGYVDSSWGGSYDKKSFAGFVFKIGKNIFAWESKKQQCVSLSSTEAEYVGLCQASKEAIYLNNILSSIVGDDSRFNTKPVVLYNDNQSAHKIASNKMNHNRTKHINIKYHFIREAIIDNLVEIRYMPTEVMIADIMTKCLHGPRIKQFIPELCLEKIFIKGAG